MTAFRSVWAMGMFSAFSVIILDDRAKTKNGPSYRGLGPTGRPNQTEEWKVLEVPAVLPAPVMDKALPRCGGNSASYGIALATVTWSRRVAEDEKQVKTFLRLSNFFCYTVVPAEVQLLLLMWFCTGLLETRFRFLIFDCGVEHLIRAVPFPLANGDKGLIMCVAHTFVW